MQVLQMGPHFPGEVLGNPKTRSVCIYETGGLLRFLNVKVFIVG